MLPEFELNRRNCNEVRHPSLWPALRFIRRGAFFLRRRSPQLSGDDEGSIHEIYAASFPSFTLSAMKFVPSRALPAVFMASTIMTVSLHSFLFAVVFVISRSASGRASFYRIIQLLYLDLFLIMEVLLQYVLHL